MDDGPSILGQILHSRKARNRLDCLSTVSKVVLDADIAL